MRASATPFIPPGLNPLAAVFAPPRPAPIEVETPPRPAPVEVGAPTPSLIPEASPGPTKEELFAEWDDLVLSVAGFVPDPTELAEAKRLADLLDHPYHDMYGLAPGLLNWYLEHKSVVPEMFHFLPYLMEYCIRLDPMYADFDWDLLITKLQLRREELPPPPARELYLSNVGDVSRLISAASLGYIDHRLEHGIVTIQRLIRYRRSNPPPPEETAHRKWYREFETNWHSRPSDGSWDRHHIHLAHFNQIKNVNLVLGEISVFAWNRDLIWPYIRAFTSTSDQSGLPSYELAIERLTAVKIGELARSKLDRLTKLVPSEPDYDFYSKLFEVVGCYHRGAFDQWRPKTLNGLKFCTVKPRGADTFKPKTLALRITNELVTMPLAVAARILEKTSECTGSNGQKLLRGFAQVEIDRIPTSEVRGWCLAMILDSLPDLIGKFGSDYPEVTPTNLQLFLRNDICPELIEKASKIISLVRKILTHFQTRLRTERSLYPPVLSYYTPVVESITI